MGHFLPGVLNRRISLWSPSPRYHRSRAKGGRTLAGPSTQPVVTTRASGKMGSQYRWPLLFTCDYSMLCLHSCHAGSDLTAGALCWALLGSAGLLSLYTAIYCHYNALLHHYHYYHLTIIITTPHMYFIFPIHSLTSDQPGKQPKISRN